MDALPGSPDAGVAGALRGECASLRWRCWALEEQVRAGGGADAELRTATLRAQCQELLADREEANAVCEQLRFELACADTRLAEQGAWVSAVAEAEAESAAQRKQSLVEAASLRASAVAADRVAAAEETITELRRSAQQLADSHASQLARAEVQARQAAAEQAAAGSERDAARWEAVRLREALAAARKEVVRLEAELAEAATLNASLQSEAEALRAELEGCERRRAEECAEAVAELEQLRAHVAAVQQQRERLQKDDAGWQQQLAVLHSEAGDCAVALTDALKLSESRAKRREALIGEYKEALRDAELTRDEAQERCAELELKVSETLQECQEEMAALQRAHEDEIQRQHSEMGIEVSHLDGGRDDADGLEIAEVGTGASSDDIGVELPAGFDERRATVPVGLGMSGRSPTGKPLTGFRFPAAGVRDADAPACARSQSAKAVGTSPRTAIAAATSPLTPSAQPLCPQPSTVRFARPSPLTAAVATSPFSVARSGSSLSRPRSTPRSRALRPLGMGRSLSPAPAPLMKQRSGPRSLSPLVPAPAQEHVPLATRRRTPQPACLQPGSEPTDQERRSLPPSPPPLVLDAGGAEQSRHATGVQFQLSPRPSPPKTPAGRTAVSPPPAMRQAVSPPPLARSVSGVSCRSPSRSPRAATPAAAPLGRSVSGLSQRLVRSPSGLSGVSGAPRSPAVASIAASVGRDPEKHRRMAELREEHKREVAALRESHEALAELQPRHQELVAEYEAVLHRQEEQASELEELRQEAEDTEELRAAALRCCAVVGVRVDDIDALTALDSAAAAVTQVRESVAAAARAWAASTGALEQRVAGVVDRCGLDRAQRLYDLVAPRVRALQAARDSATAESEALRAARGRAEADASAQHQRLLALQGDNLKIEFDRQQLSAEAAQGRAATARLTEELAAMRRELEREKGSSQQKDERLRALERRASAATAAAATAKEPVPVAAPAPAASSDAASDSQFRRAVASVTANLASLRQHVDRCAWGRTALDLADSLVGAVEGAAARCRQLLAEDGGGLQASGAEAVVQQLHGLAASLQVTRRHREECFRALRAHLDRLEKGFSSQLTALRRHSPDRRDSPAAVTPPWVVPDSAHRGRCVSPRRRVDRRLFGD